MSIAEKLTSLATNLQGVLDNSNAALVEKGAAEAANLKGLAAAIRAIEGVEAASGSKKVSGIVSGSMSITGLPFTPTRVIAYAGSGADGLMWFDTSDDKYIYIAEDDTYTTSATGSHTFSSNGFKITVGSSVYISNTFYWLAIKEA